MARAPKGGKTTTIPICQQAAEVLRSLDVTSPFVFPEEERQATDGFQGTLVEDPEGSQLA